MMKLPLIFSEDYIIHLEFFDGFYWIHMDVFKWNKKSKNEILQNLKDISLLVKMPLRCLAGSENLKLQKFSKVLGCVKEAELATKDGLAFVFKWG